MGLFSSLFGSKKPTEPIAAPETPAKELPEIRPEDFVDHSDPDNTPSGKIYYGTSMPIDAVYAFISRDYEEDGYNDAMCNADCAYKDSKKVIIRNELKRLFEQVTLRYKGDLRDIEVQIGILEQQGLINTSLTLKARKQTYLEHMEVLAQMRTSLDRDEEQLLSMVKSYERGFLKGLAAKSETLLRHER